MESINKNSTQPGVHEVASDEFVQMQLGAVLLIGVDRDMFALCRFWSRSGSVILILGKGPRLKLPSTNWSVLETVAMNGGRSLVSLMVIVMNALSKKLAVSVTSTVKM